VVLDEIVGTGRHCIRSLWTAPFATDDTLVDGAWRFRSGAGTVTLEFRSLAGTEGEVTERVPSSPAATAAWYSPSYGVREPAPAVAVSDVGSLPLRRLTLIGLGEPFRTREATATRLAVTFADHSFEAAWAPPERSADRSVVLGATLRLPDGRSHALS